MARLELSGFAATATEARLVDEIRTEDMHPLPTVSISHVDSTIGTDGDRGGVVGIWIVFVFA